MQNGRQVNSNEIERMKKRNTASKPNASGPYVDISNLCELVTRHRGHVGDAEIGPHRVPYITFVRSIGCPHDRGQVNSSFEAKQD